MSDQPLTYGKINREAAQEEQKRLDQRGLGDFLKLVPGRNVLRFLPPPAGKDLPFCKVFVHWVKTPEGPTAKCGCPRKLDGDACVVCHEVWRLRQTRDPVDEKRARSMSAKMEVYAQVVDLTSVERMAKGVQTYPFGVGIYDALLAYLTDPQDPVDFTDPDAGFVVIIDREGTGELTEYKTRLARLPQSLAACALAVNKALSPGDGKELGDKWLAEIRDLAPAIRLKRPEEALALPGAPVAPTEVLVPGAPPKALGASASGPKPPTAMDAAADAVAAPDTPWWEGTDKGGASG